MRYEYTDGSNEEYNPNLAGILIRKWKVNETDSLSAVCFFGSNVRTLGDDKICI